MDDLEQLKKTEKEVIDVKLDEFQGDTEKNELIKNTVPMDLYASDDEFNVLKGLDLVKPEDIDYLQKHGGGFQERFVKRAFFRSDFEMRYGVLSNNEHPTPDSKYWQAIGEQAVHVQEFISIGYEYKKLLADIEYTQAQIEDFEYQLSNDFEHNFERKKIEAKLKKKQVQLQEKQFGLVLQRKTAKERIKEIKNWDKIIDELKPQVKHGLDDFEKHHAERYMMRYGQRLQNLNLLNSEDKEHVIKHFTSFAQAPENKELAQRYISGNRQLPNQINNQNILPPTEIPVNNLENEIEVKETSQLDFKSKQEMMEKDPITQKFFGRKVRKILVATPHRSKDDPNVTNFFKMQTPAAFDVMIEQPYGFTVPDARNFIVNKAIEEEFDYIFFVDDDVLVPRNALVQLIHHKSDIVGGFYYRKYFPLESCGMHVDNINQPIPIEDFKIGDVIHNTLVLPSGCTLIKVDLFKKMESPWYRTCTVNNRPTITEDTYLCQKIRDLSMDIITDIGVQCIHVDKEKGTLYGHPEIVNVEKNQVYQQYREYFAI